MHTVTMNSEITHVVCMAVDAIGVQSFLNIAAFARTVQYVYSDCHCAEQPSVSNIVLLGHYV